LDSVMEFRESDEEKLELQSQQQDLMQFSTHWIAGPFALADVEALKQWFSQAEFKDIRIDILQITFGFDSP
jgi:hypothetical protein